MAALKSKTPSSRLIDLLDPSREVDSRYLNYVIADKKGKLYTGIIATETASTIILRRAERAEEALLREDVENIQSTNKSLMPEGLEKQMKEQEIADLIAYLLWVINKGK
jgi:putative heme-binding domain-containing protein